MISNENLYGLVTVILKRLSIKLYLQENSSEKREFLPSQFSSPHFLSQDTQGFPLKLFYENCVFAKNFLPFVCVSILVVAIIAVSSFVYR